MKIGMASIDENGKIYGGKAGDQTGKEVLIRDWYNKPWNVIIRPKNQEDAKKMAEDMKKACINDNIGYDQWNREDLVAQLKKVNWDFSKVSPTETDCSALVAAIIAKYYGEAAVRNAGRGNKMAYTGDLKALCQATGKFDFLTDAKYLNSSDYLQAGDILLNESKHAAMAIENGSKAAPAVVTPAPVAPAPEAPKARTLKSGCKGEDVKTLQANLNKIMNAGLAVDGDFGPKTDAAVRAFQKKYGLTVDGLFGPKSTEKMEQLLKAPAPTPAQPKGYTGEVTAKSGLNVRAGAGTGYKVVKVLSRGTKVTITSETNGWGKIADGQYVSLTYIKKV